MRKFFYFKWFLGLLMIFTMAFLSPAFYTEIYGAVEEERITGEVNFTILHTNDEHSAIVPHSPAVDYQPGGSDRAIGGFARLAGAVEEIRKEKEGRDEPVLLLNAGDFLGGGAFSWLVPMSGMAGAELTIMQEMGYDVVTIGNHEYDYGPDLLADYFISAGYPEAHKKTLILASNTKAPANHSLSEKDLYRRNGIIELDNGLKVGVFALMGDSAIIVASRTGDIEFLDQHQVAREMVDDLKGQGAQVIVALTHSGLNEDKALAGDVDGIDVIVGGHCHTPLYEPVIENETIIAQTGAYLEYFGELELAYNAETKKVRLRNRENNRDFLVPVNSELHVHEDIADLIDNYLVELNNIVSMVTEGRFNDIYDTVALLDFEIEDYRLPEESPAGNFVTDAMRLAAQDATGERVDVAFQTNGSIRRGFIPGKEHAPGVLSFYEITKAVGIGYGDDGYPGYPMASFYLTGKELYRLVEASAFLAEGVSYSSFIQTSGLRYSYNPRNAVMFTLPFVNVPVPSLRAVTEAAIYAGDGVQGLSDSYIDIKRDDALYHLVTGTTMISYMKMAADVSPLLIQPKNSAGEPIDLDNPAEYLVYREDGRELKIWEAVVSHAASQPAGEEGIAKIPDYYHGTAGRVNKVSSFPNAVIIGLVFLLIIFAIVFLVRRRRIRKRRSGTFVASA